MKSFLFLNIVLCGIFAQASNPPPTSKQHKKIVYIDFSDEKGASRVSEVSQDPKVQEALNRLAQRADESRSQNISALY